MLLKAPPIVAASLQSHLLFVSFLHTYALLLLVQELVRIILSLGVMEKSHSKGSIPSIA